MVTVFKTVIYKNRQQGAFGPQTVGSWQTPVLTSLGKLHGIRGIRV